MCKTNNVWELPQSGLLHLMEVVKLLTILIAIIVVSAEIPEKELSEKL